MSSSHRFHLPSLLQLLLSASGLLLSLGGMVMMLVIGVVMLVGRKYANSELASIFSVMWQSGLVSLLTLPSIGFAVFRLLGKPLPAWLCGTKRSLGYRLASYTMIFLPVLILAGAVLVSKSLWLWALLPPLQILVVAIPLWWWFELGHRKLPDPSPQRSWGVLNFGLLITPTVLVVVEVILVGILLVVFALWLTTRPDLVREFERIGQRLAMMGMDQQAIGLVIKPYLRQPMVVFGFLVFFSGIIPLLEEMLKPLALWALLPRQLTPAEGFVVGLICGASFALLESLGMLAQAGETRWAVTVVGRIGTGLLHVTTTGLVGWGLASAWRSGSYLRLGLIYLVAVTLHGVWNAFAILFSLRLILPISPSDAGLPLMQWIQISPLALGLLGLTLLLILVGSNRILRREAQM